MGLRHRSYLLEAKGKAKKKSGLEKFKEKHGIVGGHSVGFSEKEQKWYGWSHRAIVGFGVGDKIFEPDYGDDKTPFVKHGSKAIRDMKGAKKAAVAFAKYVETTDEFDANFILCADFNWL
jgi:hypothetical protein